MKKPARLWRRFSDEYFTVFRKANGISGQGFAHCANLIIAEGVGADHAAFGQTIDLDEGQPNRLIKRQGRLTDFSHAGDKHAYAAAEDRMCFSINAAQQTGRQPSAGDWPQKPGKSSEY